MTKLANYSSNRQRAVVIGVSDYPPPFTKLPAVSADVREIAKLLSSRRGTFSSEHVFVLTDQDATKTEIASVLQKTFESATADETLFVHLAGHGDVDGNEYFFLPCDTDAERVSETAIPLSTIKALFDATSSNQVCLWLDFCHSGGMLARDSKGDDDWAIITRELQIVHGQGKVIYAACGASQSAYESSTVGHGLFTHALLEGLKGNAALNGEVTIPSLFDYIDRQVGNRRLRPEFFGHLKGRMVLMHYPRPIQAATPSSKRPQRSDVRQQLTVTWVYLEKRFLPAHLVRHNSDNTITLQVIPEDSEQDAFLTELRPSQYGGSPLLAFACENDAVQVRMKKAASEVVGRKKSWTLNLTVEQQSFGDIWTEASINTHGKLYSADDIAQFRARRILLNDSLPQQEAVRGLSSECLLESHIVGSNSICPVKASPIQTVYASHCNHPAWQHFARLIAVYFLKASGTVESILQLNLVALRSGSLSVRFRGRRRRRALNIAPTIIEFSGTCPLE